MQLEILRAIQGIANPVLDIVMECVTMIAEPVFLMAVFCAVYWCFDKRRGRFLAAAVCASVCLNGVVKDWVKAARPIGETGILSRRVETATGYSFPSGHTQNAASFCSALFLIAEKAWQRVILVILPLLVGFSRLYLGVHYPTDVLGGLVFGILASMLIHDLLIVRENLRAALLVMAALGLAALMLGETADTFKSAGLMAGAVAGLALEEKLVRFSTAGITRRNRILRLACGMALVGCAYALPKLALPDNPAADACRYALVSFVATGGWPWIFKRLGW